MNKKYIMPTIMVRTIKPTVILAGSDPVTPKDTQGEGPQLSKDRSIFDYETDTEE